MFTIVEFNPFDLVGLEVAEGSTSRPVSRE